jgi:1-deoxy-D-xylulose-5-phosphate synthase
LIRGKDTCLISYGPDLIRLEKLIKDNNLEVGLVNARFIKPVDNDMLNELSNRYSKIVVIEQVVNNGSLYSLILDYYNKKNISINIDSMNFNVDILLPHGKIEEVLNNYGLSDNDILQKIK